MPTSTRLNLTLAAVGTRGDVQPMLAVAHALQAHGHRVRLAAPPDFADWVQANGIEFAPAGTPIKPYLEAHPDVLTGRPMAALRAAIAYFADQMPVVAQDLAAAAQGADALAWGGLAVAAPSVAEQLQRPCLAVMYSPCMLPFASGQHPPPSMPWQGLPGWVNRLLWSVNSRFTGLVLDPVHNRMRARLGLPPVRIQPYLQQACRYHVAADPGVFPADPGWGPAVQQGQFIFFDDPRPLPADLQQWLDEGEAPVFVGFGSMGGEATRRMEGVVHSALAALGRRGLVGAGWAGIGRQLPPGWRAVQEVSHQTLFPRMAAVVHHGGSGTTANALRAGLPQVVVPLILDQYHHAHRLHVAGLMPRPVSMESITGPQLAQALAQVIASPAGPRQHIAARLAAARGGDAVARHLETLAGR